MGYACTAVGPQAHELRTLASCVLLGLLNAPAPSTRQQQHFGFSLATDKRFQQAPRSLHVLLYTRADSKLIAILCSRLCQQPGNY